ncbi:hypothetical protein N7509_012788 [Penicillium cosmopolitanum]|uniref:Uncharacterized protein n=1 Tax=Penicillium cosmopolitanum TaxID=1131564 RepID=A0A9W9SD26_9EURO|nr:uncharacterized protein N7509_012788 [Penicillium cosmopolitanum]KAJ5375902.1 hypothetical protein N7509_012788 [Penicillium cosmopolitanum]
MSTTQVVQGFSLTNRWLLYASMMLSPAQFAGGVGSNIPTNVGFLAYNWYTQIQWYQAVQAKELHALSLLPIHFNFIYAISYLGGVSSGNIFLSAFLSLGTVGVLILNTVSAWVSWATNQPEGFGEYQFFFFGWRTLSKGWHIFTLLWQIGDSFLVLNAALAAGYLSTVGSIDSEEVKRMPWYLHKYPAIPLGAIAMLIIGWPLILWTELIVQRNHIESETDMVAVWLFVAQIGLFLIPSWSDIRRLTRRSE